ncbi:MAG: DoxX family protein, partial [Actinomycetota bacterium]|nr:DoxX family protein [Actinomycetota bacterium]
MNDVGASALLLGRILIAVYFVAIAGAFHLTKGPMAVGFARQMGFPFPGLASWVSGIWLVAAGLSIGLGIWADLGALMIAAFVIPAAWWFHRFWVIEDENQKQNQTLLFWRNVTFLGAALALFAFFATFGHDLPWTVTDPLFD